MNSDARACLKIHSRHLPAPLRGIFGPNSVNVARYASLIGTKSPTKWDAQLTESNFQTRSSKSLGTGAVAIRTEVRRAMPNISGGFRRGL